MLNPRFLKCVLSEVKTGRNSSKLKVEMLDSKNQIYKTTKGKAEVKLALYLKTINIDERSKKRILSLIEDYGQEKYDEGSNNNSSLC